MIQIAHCADIHYCPKHLDWVHKAFTAFVDDATKMGTSLTSAAVIAGDSFDASMGIHEPAVSAYLEQVIRLASYMPVLVLQGTFSHDRPGCLDILKELPTKYPIFVADEPCQVMLSGDNKWDEFTGTAPANTKAIFSCLPSLNKADPFIMEAGVKDYIGTLSGAWALHNEFARAREIPTVLVTHGTVTGCVTESGYAMISPDWEFDLDMLYGFGTDAVMLGHIHAHQGWENGEDQAIAYPGSIARLVHGDHDPKGYLLWSIKPGDPRYSFIEVPSRRLLEIEYDGPPDIAELEELAKKADANTFVRVRWSVDQEFAHSVDKQAIRELFEQAAECKLEGMINPVQSVRAAGIGKAMTLREKLGYYATTTGDDERLDGLEHRLFMLQTMDNDEIIKQLTV